MPKRQQVIYGLGAGVSGGILVLSAALGLGGNNGGADPGDVVTANEGNGADTGISSEFGSAVSGDVVDVDVVDSAEAGTPDSSSQDRATYTLIPPSLLPTGCRGEVSIGVKPDLVDGQFVPADTTGLPGGSMVGAVVNYMSTDCYPVNGEAVLVGLASNVVGDGYTQDEANAIGAFITELSRASNDNTVVLWGLPNRDGHWDIEQSLFFPQTLVASDDPSAAVAVQIQFQGHNVAPVN